MTKKLRAIILSLMLAFSLSLITGCQKAKEQAGEVKEEATETKAEIKENAAETAREIKDEAVEPLKQDKEKAAKTTGEIKDEAMETVREITIIGDKENAAETAEDTEEKEMEEIEPSEEAKTVLTPTLIAEPDYSVSGSTVWVTLEWYPVYHHRDPVKYFLKLYSGDAFVYSSGWVSGTTLTIEIPSPCIYFWHVKARNDVSLQESVWSRWNSFLVNDYCPFDD